MKLPRADVAPQPSPPHSAAAPESQVDALIEALVADARPLRGSPVARRLLAPLFLGELVSIILVGTTLGYRADLAQTLGAPIFWIKLGYVLALGVISLWGLERLARPAAPADDRLQWLLAPIATLLVICAAQLEPLSDGDAYRLMRGATAAVCPVRIVAFSTPPFLALIWAVRGLAPMRLRVTGALLGLSAGGFGAAAYALACGEPAVLFLAAWYGLGILTVSAIGWVVGPAALRW